MQPRAAALLAFFVTAALAADDGSDSHMLLQAGTHVHSHDVAFRADMRRMMASSADDVDFRRLAAGPPRPGRRAASKTTMDEYLKEAEPRRACRLRWGPGGTRGGSRRTRTSPPGPSCGG
eukprot:CAMPEP_0179379130 /NCGR_PEP_ID=MMETSP0797-20121207/89684_1 /TAXON_ID=47934 /ORGANISM="Dinophysis acuminata, Strain DAEP01" /LENGTH=119 /DNA_ID=CAMNT_0021095207 /DNA_START=53 /DNA_END=409 /DNA_ORIENTATION=+